jgi:hypothetical protein
MPSGSVKPAPTRRCELAASDGFGSLRSAATHTRKPFDDCWGFIAWRPALRSRVCTPFPCRLLSRSSVFRESPDAESA